MRPRFKELRSRDKFQKNPTTEVEKYGLFELYPSPESKEVLEPLKVDIIAVHGLNGDAFMTWTDRESGQLWLRDILPTTLPNSRIMTLGYNPASAFRDSIAAVSNSALDLLSRLHGKRMTNTEKTRPILFVCHGLGGIITKKALSFASDKGSCYKDLLDACQGIMFMGTPHRGCSSLARWSATVSQLFKGAHSVGSIQVDPLRALCRRSKKLWDISQDFIQFADKFQIISVYERNFIPGLRKIIVDESSAILGVPKEIIIPMNADHYSMCHFSSADSQKYLPIKAAFLDLAERVTYDTAGRTKSRRFPDHTPEIRQLSIDIAQASATPDLVVLNVLPAEGAVSDNYSVSFTKPILSTENLVGTENRENLEFNPIQVHSSSSRDAAADNVDGYSSSHTVEIKINSLGWDTGAGTSKEQFPDKLALKIPPKTRISNITITFDKGSSGIFNPC